MSIGDKVAMRAVKAPKTDGLDVDGLLAEEERQLAHASLYSVSELLLIADSREKVNTTRLSSLLTLIADRMEPPE